MVTRRGGGRWRVDQTQFAIQEELIDGCNGAGVSLAIDENVGLIVGGIDLPCPEYEWDIFYGIGREGRSRKNIHEGPQSFTGTIPESYVLFSTRLPFKMILGCLSRAPEAITGGCCCNSSSFTATTDSCATDAGSTLTCFKTACACSPAVFAVFSGITVGYIGAGGGGCTINVFPTKCIDLTIGACCGRPIAGWNGPQPDIGDVYEIRRVDCVGTATGNKYAVGTQILPTMTWAARLRNSTTHGGTSVGGNLTVNYLGGKVNRATISAESGEFLKLALDEVFFKDLIHDASLPSACVAKRSATVTAPTAAHPLEKPLVFSEGTISLFCLDTSFARIRNFSLEINNNLEIERYISTTCLAGNTKITQIPFELVEGNREITLEVEAVMETREYWEHLMRQGQNDGLSAKTGFDIRLEFRPDVAALEKLVIQGPANIQPTIIDVGTSIDQVCTNQSAGTNVGAVLNSAPHVVSGEGENLILVRMEMNIPSLVIWWDDVT